MPVYDVLWVGNPLLQKNSSFWVMGSVVPIRRHKILVA